MNETSSNLTNKTTSTRQWDHDYEIVKVWIRALTAFVVLTGNSICVTAFLGSKSLRKRPHYLLVHLCMADFLVGVGILLRLAVDVSYWKYGTAGLYIRSFTYIIDYFSNLASIYVLTSISIERFLAIVLPIFHRLNDRTLYAVLMVIPWTVSCVVTIIYYLSNLFSYINIHTFELIYLITITIPVLLILITYSFILVKVRKNCLLKNNRTLALRDRRLASTLLMVTLASVLTWGPYNVYYVLGYYCKSCGIEFSDKVFFCLIVLQYWNSAVNLVVYFYRIPLFKQVIMNWCRKHKVRPHNPRFQSSNRQIVTNNERLKNRKTTSL